MAMLIGLAGTGGVGKTTTARTIERIAPTWFRVAIGDPLRMMLAAYYKSADLDEIEIDRRLDGDLKRTPDPLLGGRTPTHALQTLGTEWGRQTIHPDLWVDLWTVRARRWLDKGFGVIQDSVRFRNEGERIHELGGLVVRLVGPTTMVGGEAGHVSEHALEGFGFDGEVTVDAPAAVIAARVLDLWQEAAAARAFAPVAS